MSDFTTIEIQYNVGDAATPNWQTGSGANKGLRWAGSSAILLTTASAAWPSVTKPSSGTAGVPFAYVFTADAVGHGVFGGGASSAPATFATTQYRWGRVSWDNLGTFASAPILTAYPTTGHGAITPGDGSLLGGHATDTTSRSYLKGSAFGRVTSAGAPAAGPGGAPVVTDGTTGAVTPSAGANWSAWQSMQGANDWLAFPNTPAATTADSWEWMLRLFLGENLTGGVLSPVLTFAYTFS